MSELITMRFDGTRTVHEYVLEIINYATKLKTLGMIVDESFLVQFILNSSPTKYGPLRMLMTWPIC